MRPPVSQENTNSSEAQCRQSENWIKSHKSTESATIERLAGGRSSGLNVGFHTTIGNTKAAITFSGLFAPSLPIGTGCHAKIALERLTKSDLRIVADRQSDFNQCRWVCSQQSSSFREAHTGEILHGRLANQLLEFGG